MERHKYVLFVAFALVPALAGCRVSATTTQEAKAPQPQQQASQRHGVATQVMQASDEQCDGKAPSQ
ncbi:hypothetical protein LVJ94_43785 [Pendulispora rubella]|uniref:Secreted protein n=1 Tax=Pendulispora rubella TaxID=2741070 RepID=A0ABZ2KZ16_9BACT